MSTNTQRPGTNLSHVGLLRVVVGIVLAVATLAAGGNAVLGWVSALGLLMVGWYGVLALGWRRQGVALELKRHDPL